MAYEVVVIGRAEGPVWADLEDRLGPASIRAEGGRLTLSLPDQSALVALLGRLHDLNITVEGVRHLEH